jgi:branched-chain amino acid transport system substrate-binding protein
MKLYNSYNKKVQPPLVLFMIVGSVLLSGCASEETIQVGWIGPLTGPVSLLGVENVKSVQLAINEYQSAKLSSQPNVLLHIQDDQYDADLSMQAYRTLVDENDIKILFLSTYSAVFALADVTLADDVLVVNPIDNDARLARLNKNQFFIAKQTRELGDRIATSMLNSNFKKAFILYFSDDEFMPGLASSVRTSLVGYGREAIAKSYSITTEDFSGYFPFAQKADVIVLLGYAELGGVMKQFRDAGFSQQLYTANIGMAEHSDGAIEGAKFTHFTAEDGNREIAEAFLERYESEYHSYPILPWTAMQAYDAANIVLEAIRKSADFSENELVATLRAHLHGIQHFPGTSGNISIESDGTSRGISWSMYQYMGGNITRE